MKNITVLLFLFAFSTWSVGQKTETILIEPLLPSWSMPDDSEMKGHEVFITKQAQLLANGKPMFHYHVYWFVPLVNVTRSQVLVANKENCKRAEVEYDCDNIIFVTFYNLQGKVASRVKLVCDPQGNVAMQMVG